DRAGGDARSRQRIRARGGAGVVALSAQSTAARHGLGVDGALARGAGTAGRRAPAAQAGAGVGDAQGAGQATARRRATSSPPPRGARTAQNGLHAPDQGVAGAGGGSGGGETVVGQAGVSRDFFTPARILVSNRRWAALLALLILVTAATLVTPYPVFSQ